MAAYDEIMACWDAYQVLLKTCEKARDLTCSNHTKYTAAFSLPFLGEKGDYKTKAQTYFDELTDRIKDDLVLALVAKFEFLVFCRLKSATGNVSKIACKQYKRSEPFGHFTDRLVVSPDNDIKNLGGIHNIADDRIPSDLRDRFHDVIKERNRLAHGRRFGQKTALTPVEIRDVLCEMLKHV